MSDLTKVVPGTYKAIISQFVGLITDAYDLTLIVAMTAILSKVLFPPSSTPLVAAMAVVLAYSITVFFRPIGAAIFGHLGDKIGRKYSLMVTIAGVGVSSALVGLLPTAAQAGIWSYIFFLILRMVLGIFYGGEYSGGFTYVIEWTPPRWRGVASGLALGGYTIGLFIAGITVGSVTNFLGEDAMVAYGWRYLFFSGLLPVAVAVAIRYSMRESPIFEMLKSKGKVEKAPFFSLFKKPVVYDFLQIMMLMTGLNFLYSGTYFLPIIIGNKPAMVGASLAAFMVAVNGLAQFLALMTYGPLSQRVGRRRLGMAWAIMSFVIAIPMYYGLLQAATILNLAFLIVMVIVVGIVNEGPFGAIAAYLSERFRTSHRASGVGFGYSSGYFIGAWYSLFVPALHTYVLQGIEPATSIWLSEAVLMMIGAVIFGLGFYLGPETVGKKLAEEAT
jgi:MFS family permease